jgi:hypothetical protein
MSGERNQTLSPADIYALKHLPSGLFHIGQVSYLVRRPRWRCDRLVQMGFLWKEVVREDYGTMSGAFGYQTYYRKTPQSKEVKE